MCMCSNIMRSDDRKGLAGGNSTSALSISSSLSSCLQGRQRTILWSIIFNMSEFSGIFPALKTNVNLYPSYIFKASMHKTLPDTTPSGSPSASLFSNTSHPPP